MKKGRRSKKLPVWAIVLILLAAAALGAAAFFAGTGWYILDGIERVPINEEELSINEGLNAPQAAPDGQEGQSGPDGGGGETAGSSIVNIAVFGVDSQEEGSFSGGADTVMIASVNRQAGWVKLTSILRDSWMDVAGRRSMKLTDIYRNYGPAVTIQTLNRKFQMNIADYVTINVHRLADAVDLIGGVDLEITQAELEQINRHAQTEEKLDAPGRVHLNGTQAAMYARIRKIDSDNERVVRQRKLLQGILERVRGIPAIWYPGTLRTLLGLVETSMTYSEIMAFAPMAAGELELETLVIPGQEEKPYGGQNYPGLEGNWVWVYDYDAAARHLYRFIYT